MQRPRNRTNKIGTQIQSRLRLKGFGLPRLQGGGKGDEYLRIIVHYPKTLNEKQKRLAEELRKNDL
jgi:DnaJ-class molecular chaperone